TNPRITAAISSRAVLSVIACSAFLPGSSSGEIPVEGLEICLRQGHLPRGLLRGHDAVRPLTHRDDLTGLVEDFRFELPKHPIAAYDARHRPVGAADADG